MTDQDDERVVGNDQLVAEIVTAYGLQSPRSWSDLGGSWTTNLRLDYPDRPLVARIHQFSTPPARLMAVQAARRAVAEAGLPTVRWIPTPDGQSMIILSDGHAAELEPFVEWSARMNTPALLEQGFRLLGRTHDALRQATLPREAATVRYANHLHAADALSAAQRGADRIRSWQDSTLSAFADRVVEHLAVVDHAEAQIHDQLPTQIVHGDFWDNNVLFQDGQVVALLDFDFMAARPRIDDLALPCYFYLLEPGHGLPTADDRHVIRRLVDAYDAGTNTPLSEIERTALPLAVARQPAWSVGRWVLDLDEDEARKHATEAAAEFPTAEQLLRDLSRWQEALL